MLDSSRLYYEYTEKEGMSILTKKKTARVLSSADLYFFEELSTSMGVTEAKKWLKSCRGESSVNSSRSTSPVRQRAQPVSYGTLNVENIQSRRYAQEAVENRSYTPRACDKSTMGAGNNSQQGRELALKFEHARRDSDKSEQAGLLYTDAAHLLDE
ncbi:hypothetical protein GUITHDRAFT_161957 [Guillardia theta CCMP2712]|uniref:Uncharacterized protein n=1 Tax=Guillardia theta (strain CCMP2712) TaxID=905079 RepID=L1JN47_GUITC|nr:hypothetical protein GUITHDRAFT_161957 [Guillardia theta CCMP2712]EKX49857.1 hypothetical protein GUITHDRAFT_161957 [Guillardia theta CCMP2712]|mmetsp:Transcript_25/g.56  ORF Transcript_25/g.56 Transcript_25/m.56 type:complete len:156 (-) Transcript_25:33-500(-)|eukprot:XP_005836837.1 hypothetical protein GUITHDRAFT_161957 [Guillardia theta CCMP2712]